MIFLTHGPNCIMDSAIVFFVVAKRTESIICMLCFRRMDRSRMALNSHNLCGIVATGDILSFSVVFPLMSSYQTTLAYPFLIFFAVSECRSAMAEYEFTKGCCPRRRAASMWSVDQYRPQLSGQPYVA